MSAASQSNAQDQIPSYVRIAALDESDEQPAGDARTGRDVEATNVSIAATEPELEDTRARTTLKPQQMSPGASIARQGFKWCWSCRCSKKPVGDLRRLESRTMFVGNIQRSLEDERKLLAFFKHFGEVETVTMHHARSYKGYSWALVTYTAMRSLEKALEKQNELEAQNGLKLSAFDTGYARASTGAMSVVLARHSSGNVPEPKWFEHELFAQLSENQRVYVPIYMLLASLPFLTSWGSVMEFAHDCPTISRPVEALFAMGQIFLSVIWINIFKGLQKVVRGANTNSAQELADGEHRNDDESIAEVLKYLGDTLRNEEPSSASAIMAAIDAEHPQHKEVLSHVSQMLTARERIALWTTLEDDLVALHELDESSEPSEQQQDEGGGAEVTRQRSDSSSRSVHARGQFTLSPDVRLARRTTSAPAMSAMSLWQKHKSSMKRIHRPLSEDSLFVTSEESEDYRTVLDFLNQTLSHCDPKEILRPLREQAEQDYAYNTNVRYLKKTFWNRTGQDGADADTATEGHAAREEREVQKMEHVFSTGPFTKLAFNHSEAGLQRVTIDRGTRRRLTVTAAATMFVILSTAVFVVGYTSLGTLQLLKANFNPEGLAETAIWVDEIFFPPTECDASGPGNSVVYNQIYAVLLLVIWIPATCIGAFVLAMWMISLQLGALLAANHIHVLMERLDPAAAKQNFANPDVSVNRIPFLSYCTFGICTCSVWGLTVPAALPQILSLPVDARRERGKLAAKSGHTVCVSGLGDAAAEHVGACDV